MTAKQYVEKLHLQPHPEGGYFKETYRCSENIESSCLPERFTGSRSISTSIYYLLEQGDYSGFHKIKSDECWHFYAGGQLLIHVIETTGNYYCIKLGGDILSGETFQFVVPAGAWFASEPAADVEFSLVGCTVAPGFDFEDFGMAEKNEMMKLFPEYRKIIERLTR
jgi:uncharacterized protein